LAICITVFNELSFLSAKKQNVNDHMPDKAAGARFPTMGNGQAEIDV